MPPKPAAAKEKKEKPKESGFGAEVPPIPEHMLVRYPQRWVQVHFKCLPCSLLDDVLRVPQSATLLMVELLLVKHHGGSITKLEMWKNSVEPRNRLHNFALTVKEVWQLDDASPSQIDRPNPSSIPLGVQRYGSYGEPEDHKVVLFYDFKVPDSECPLLLRSPRYIVGQVDSKQPKTKA